jgi:pheromone shutdown protein TraB
MLCWALSVVLGIFDIRNILEMGSAFVFSYKERKDPTQLNPIERTTLDNVNFTLKMSSEKFCSVTIRVHALIFIKDTKNTHLVVIFIYWFLFNDLMSTTTKMTTTTMMTTTMAATTTTTTTTTTKD